MQKVDLKREQALSQLRTAMKVTVPRLRRAIEDIQAEANSLEGRIRECMKVLR